MALCLGAAALAEAPRLFSTPGLQSPVHAAGGDLLLLAGYPLDADDLVAYRAITQPTEGWPADFSPASGNGPQAGIAEVIREASDAQALAVRLPRELDARRVYQLAIRNRGGEWSNPVFVNDPRVQWLTPAVLPTRGTVPGLSRTLRIVGHNLLSDQPLRVRLRGPQPLELETLPPRERLAEFVAEVELPAVMAPGDYSLSVSREGRYWSEWSGSLRISAEPARATTLSVAEVRFGGCRADDDADDTACVLAALGAAAATRATLHFPAGTWRLDAPQAAGVEPTQGIHVSRGVQLVGDGAARSRIERGAAWNRARGSPPLFNLAGENRVSGLGFVDRSRGSAERSEFLQLGRAWWRKVPAAEREIRQVSIVDNEFSGADIAIREAGRPISQLVITGNRFRARVLGISLAGDGNNVADIFRIEDTVIRHNVFEPGSYIDLKQRQGARAAELGAGTRLDFSDNIADGVSTAGLDGAGDAAGWRAAFFWHLRGPQEQLLISANQMSCTGDKVGDGEAIALDNNHNHAGFEWARTVVAASADAVTVPGPLLARHEGNAVDIRYYRSHWVQVAEGPGLGQARRVTGIVEDAGTGRVTLSVSPAWDVVPQPGRSRITLARTFWQTLIVGNRVDGRAPCRKSNRSEPESGLISLWAQSTDTVVAHNQQFDTDGILFHQAYKSGVTSFQGFLEIRGNEIRGEYSAGLAASESGIRGPHGAAREADPPVEAFGVSIAHNLIENADSAGAAIRIPLSWYAGPAPHQWPLVDRLLIFRNRLAGTRTGIAIPAGAQVRRAVLDGNSCPGVRTPVALAAAGNLAWCAGGDDACECR